MQSRKKTLFFALAMVPLAAVGGWFVSLYQLDLYGEAIAAEVVAQLGSTTVLCAVAAVQSAVYAFVCAFFGRILAEKTGLWRPLGFERRPLMVTLAVSLCGGLLFSLDYWTFGAAYPAIQTSAAAGLTLPGVISAVLYGGIVEEFLLRLFFMSLVALILQKLTRGTGRGTLVAANGIAALLFAAGHLPATITTFGGLTALLVARCFLLNGGFGLLFGWLYRKYGIGYAMLCHMLLHLISRAIWVALI